MQTSCNPALQSAALCKLIIVDRHRKYCTKITRLYKQIQTHNEHIKRWVFKHNYKLYWLTAQSILRVFQLQADALPFHILLVWDLFGRIRVCGPLRGIESSSAELSPIPAPVSCLIYCRSSVQWHPVQPSNPEEATGEVKLWTPTKWTVCVAEVSACLRASHFDARVICQLVIILWEFEMRQSVKHQGASPGDVSKANYIHHLGIPLSRETRGKAERSGCIWYAGSTTNQSIP